MVSRWSSVCLSVHLWSRIRTITLVNEFSPNLVCALILWRSSLGLLMGKFCQFLFELSAGEKILSSFVNFSKYQWIFT